MSMYNMIFGQNRLSDVILATVDLTKEDVGRFRDCFVTEGKIAVYTRNGGGNRGCWHRHDLDCGNSRCKHHVEQREVDEFREVKKSGFTTYERTGKRVIEDRYICEVPNSPECACPGCIITHRLPKHPNYLYDCDDDYDCTYATVYFSFPEQHREFLRSLESGPFEPTQRWLSALEDVKQGKRPEVVEQMRPVMEAIGKAL
jgi:hypothetical protein